MVGRAKPMVAVGALAGTRVRREAIAGKASLDQQSDRARQLNPANSSSEPVALPAAEGFWNFVRLSGKDLTVPCR
jgi:hypothetical protein